MFNGAKKNLCPKLTISCSLLSQNEVVQNGNLVKLDKKAKGQRGGGSGVGWGVGGYIFFLL